MGFVSILAKIFQDIEKGIGIFTGIEPVVYQFAPAGAQATLSQVTDDLTQVGNAVTQAQAVVAAVSTPGATAASIVTAATPLVGTVISKSELVLGKKVGNQELYAQAITSITTGVVQLLDSMEAPATAAKT